MSAILRSQKDVQLKQRVSAPDPLQKLEVFQSVRVQGSGSCVVFLLASSCRGRGGVGNLLQRALQADAPAGNRDQPPIQGRSAWVQRRRVVVVSMQKLTPISSLFVRTRCNVSPCLFEVSKPQDLTPVFAPPWSSLCALPSWTSVFLAVREASWIDLLINTLFWTLLTLHFACFQVQEKIQT